MRAASSAEGAIDVPGGTRVAMVVVGFVPFLHASAVVVLVVWALAGGPGWLLGAAPAVLFLLPPLLVRLATWRHSLPAGRIDMTSEAFMRWWFTAQCQIVFARLPWLEETLRLVPALYSAWLRLWGARVGALVYWSPGVVVLDRSLLCIGDRVVFGAGARLVPHVIAPGPGGRAALFLGPITVGSDALVGAYSSLLPGSEVAPGEVTPPFRSVHAFSRVERGRRTRLAATPALDDPA